LRDCANQFTAGRPGMHGQNHANLVPARSSTVAGLQSREYATSATGLRWLLLMLQHWARSRNRHTATDEKNEKSLVYILVAISLVGTLSEKSLQLLPPDVVF